MSFKLNYRNDIFIYKDTDLPKSCQIAIDSFSNDLKALFRKPKFTKDISKASFVLLIQNFGLLEGYKIKISSNQITIIGNDDLGLIFGLYTFLENYLNVAPFYKMAHIKLSKMEDIELKEEEICEHPETRFRGWFINDEDLLCAFKSKGTRKIDYEFYHDVISPKMFKIICETALRHKINLLIPSTFIDVMQKHEYNLVKICSDMGLYVSQHHIEPLGVSKFALANYIKDNNLGCTDYSYVSNKDNLIITWEAYAKKWSDFPRVIWQLGLRSGLDRPVWDTEKNVGNSPKERGELISSEISAQFEAIKKNYKHEIYTTATLWMEGAELYKNNDLILPSETIIVLSDVGMSSLFGDDFYKLDRDENKQYGFYYHAGYVHTGAHSAEGVIPEKFSYSFDLAKQYKNNYYTILNVANVKDLLFSIFIFSKLAFKNDYKLDDIYHKYSSFYLKDNRKDLVNAIKSYYNALGDVGEDSYERFCNKYNFSYHKYEDLDFPVVNFNDGIFRSLHFSFYFEDREKYRNKKFRQMCDVCYENMHKTNEKLSLLLDKINKNYKEEFIEHWIFQSKYISECYKCLIHMDNGCDDIMSNNFSSAEKNYGLAKEQINNILKDRKTYFKGYYKDWFKGDKKLKIKRLISHLDEEKERGISLKKEGRI